MIRKKDLYCNTLIYLELDQALHDKSQKKLLQKVSLLYQFNLVIRSEIKRYQINWMSGFNDTDHTQYKIYLFVTDLTCNVPKYTLS